MWKDAESPDAGEAIVPEGTVACKLIFTAATVAQVPYLAGSIEWEVNGATNFGGTRSPMTVRRTLRSYHYLAVPDQDRENPQLVREMVKRGKRSCRCAADMKHRMGRTYISGTKNTIAEPEGFGIGENTFPRPSCRARARG